MRYSILCFLVLFLAASCKKIKEGVALKAVSVELKYPSDGEFGPQEGIKVKFRSSATTLSATTDAQGKATVQLPAGVYDITISDVRQDGLYRVIYNGLRTAVSVNDQWAISQSLSVDLTQSRASQVIIKELFVGGTPKDDGSGYFANDKYVILYNNSDVPADLSRLCFGMVGPFNSNATNNYYDGTGKLIYEADKWLPAISGFWYFQGNVILQPWQQLVISITGAINHSLTYSKSVNLSNADYCFYDLLNYTNASAYPTPSSLIPTSHYLKAHKYAAGNAWSISVNSPGFFIFNMDPATTPAAFAADPANVHTVTGYTGRKVPFDWVVDAAEVFLMNNGNNKKRFPAAIDAGFVNHINELGYSIYRNVDEEATEAISENTGKLVYEYNLGTKASGGSTDPSGIDAEASARNGARIVYSDKNNSSIDFHLRAKASLRTN